MRRSELAWRLVFRTSNGMAATHPSIPANPPLNHMMIFIGLPLSAASSPPPPPPPPPPQPPPYPPVLLVHHEQLGVPAKFHDHLPPKFDPALSGHQTIPIGHNGPCRSHGHCRESCSRQTCHHPASRYPTSLHDDSVERMLDITLNQFA
jgi:hypothetical protein